MAQIELRHLQLVQAVTDEKSLTRAGVRLNLTQSALSHQLREIEERLGTPLFHRVKKRLILTPAGERVLETARAVLPKVEEAERSLAGIRTGEEGTLRFSTQCYTCYHWLPSVLVTFRKRFPKVGVQIVVEATRRPVEALLEGTIDLAIVNRVEDGKHIALHRLFRDELMLVVPPSHRLARRKWIEAEDVASEHFYLHNSPEENYFVQKVLAPAGVTLASATQIQLTEAILSMVQAGLGVSVLADWAVAPAVRSRKVRAIRITRRGCLREWSAATLRQARPPEYLRAFVALVAKHGPGAALRT